MCVLIPFYHQQNFISSTLTHIFVEISLIKPPCNFNAKHVLIFNNSSAAKKSATLRGNDKRQIG